MVEPGIDSGKLLARIKHRNDFESAWSELYEHYSRRFYYAARRRELGHEDAADCVQTAFLKIIRGINQYHESVPAERWLWKLYINVIYDFWRKQDALETDEERLARLQREREERLTAPDVHDANVEEWGVDPEVLTLRQEAQRALAYARSMLTVQERTDWDRGRGPGHGRREWHAAFQRMLELARTYYADNHSPDGEKVDG